MPRPAELVVEALRQAIPEARDVGEWLILPSHVAVAVPDAVPCRVRVRGAEAERDGEVVVAIASADDLSALAPVLHAARWWASRVTVDGLRPGVRVRVIAPFIDAASQAFAVGDALTVREHHVNAYHEGHTVVCVERTLWVEGRTPLADDLDLLLAWEAG